MQRHDDLNPTVLPAFARRQDMAKPMGCCGGVLAASPAGAATAVQSTGAAAACRCRRLINSLFDIGLCYSSTLYKATKHVARAVGKAEFCRLSGAGLHSSGSGLYVRRRGCEDGTGRALVGRQEDSMRDWVSFNSAVEHSSDAPKGEPVNKVLKCWQEKVRGREKEGLDRRYAEVRHGATQLGRIGIRQRDGNREQVLGYSDL